MFSYLFTSQLILCVMNCGYKTLLFDFSMDYYIGERILDSLCQVNFCYLQLWWSEELCCSFIMIFKYILLKLDIICQFRTVHWGQWKVEADFRILDPRCLLQTSLVKGTLAKLREMEQFYAGRSFIRLQSRIQKEQQISSSYNHMPFCFCFTCYLLFRSLFFFTWLCFSKL